ncbi:MAG: peptide chain release factor N(5)-glutamine methyltransferase [Phycisphaerae bacterium]|nr:peptide chain release factor N(5)-glutamine methyltransferase [Phycisphaerae bacterium]
MSVPSAVEPHAAPAASTSPPASGAPGPWTTRRLMAWMTEAFGRKGLDAPRLSAEILVSRVLGCERLRLYTDPDRPASPAELQTLRDLVGRALKHEPVQYLTAEAWFFGLPLLVDRRVLIPRPCTELIVEHVLQHARASTAHRSPDAGPVRIADVCTGSGCIAVALARHLPAAEILAADLSADALDVTAANAARHGVADRVEFLRGDLLDALPDRVTAGLDYLVSNPPYISDAEWADVPPNVRDHEPELALRGGPDGLSLVRRLIEHAPGWLRPGGVLLVECAASNAGRAAELARSTAGLTAVSVLRDLEGHDRVVAAQRA